MSRGRQKKEEILLFECRVNFKDKSHLDIKDTVENGEKLNEILVREEQVECLVELLNGELQFKFEKTDKQPFCHFVPTEMDLNLDRNSQTIRFYFKNRRFPVLEIQSNIKNLEKISQFCDVKTKVIKQLGPLSFTPSQYPSESIFSTEVTTTNLRGFMNLGILTLIMSKFRDIVRNFLDYGHYINIITIEVTWLQVLTFIGGLCAPVIVQYWIEKLAYQKKLRSKMILGATWLNNGLSLTIPLLISHFMDPNPAVLALAVPFALGYTCKIVSFAHVNAHIRRLAPKAFDLMKKDKDVVKEIGVDTVSEDNWKIIQKYKSDLSQILNLRHYLFFILAPTFCYQLYYPRNKKIRWTWLMKRLAEFAVCIILELYILIQFVTPIMMETPAVIDSGNTLEIIEKVMQIAFPVLLAWVLIFFLLFHYFFNIFAELLRFADRNFYKDWWNCRDMNEYWRLWNIPIHNFLMRHIYYPMLRKKYSKGFSLFVVFFVSAIGHEYWASVPLRLFTIYTTLFFLMQVPLMILQKKLDKALKGSQLGNFMFWLGFCFVGQPTGLVLFYYMYVKMHGIE